MISKESAVWFDIHLISLPEYWQRKGRMTKTKEGRTAGIDEETEGGGGAVRESDVGGKGGGGL